jgi:antirestriction protein ArdC
MERDLENLESLMTCNPLGRGFFFRGTINHGLLSQEDVMNVHELYASVTAKIIRELEAGVVSWTQPWKNARTSGAIMPHNGATGRPYNGINVMLLWAERQDKGYRTSNWMTFKQALDMKAQVRKGEKATTVVFTKQLQVKDRETEKEKKVGMLRTYCVFNQDQIDGLPNRDYEILPPEKCIENVETFVRATEADIRLGGNKACYVPSMDFVALPPRHQFRSLEHFYATELHELAHWSAHEKRLNRDLKGRFGTKAYAAEELVAELSAAFLCAHLGIEGELRHADYVANWVALLKEDDRAIFTAASKASQAAEYLRMFSEVVELYE